MATRHYVPRAWPFAFTNGIQASWLEVDTRHRLHQAAQALVRRGLRHGDQPAAGRRAGARRRGAGDRRGAVRALRLRRARQLLNGNMADYLVPMAGEMPDIEVGHVVSPTADSELGAKGAGEAGTAGAPGCVVNAVNDALRPLGTKVITEIPVTPDVVLKALGKI